MDSSDILIDDDKMIRFLTVLTVGLFAGFTFFFAFILSPAAELLGPRSYSELFIAMASSVRWGPRSLQVLMFIFVALWMWKMRRQWRSVSFVCLSLAQLLVMQDFVLSALGHFKVGDEIRFYISNENLPLHWKELRAEWGWFMILHLATCLAAFMIVLIPLLRTWRGYEADQHRNQGYKLGGKTSTEVELHLKLHSQSNEPSATQDRTH